MSALVGDLVAFVSSTDIGSRFRTANTRRTFQAALQQASLHKGALWYSTRYVKFANDCFDWRIPPPEV